MYEEDSAIEDGDVTEIGDGEEFDMDDVELDHGDEVEYVDPSAGEDDDVIVF